MTLRALTLAIVALTIDAPAGAQTSEPKSSATAAIADPTSSASPFNSPVVDAAALGAITGKADLATTISARNTSNVSNNSVNGDSVTGSIAFDSSSFSGLNGLSLLSANTGNNVAINSSLNVNVVIRP